MICFTELVVDEKIQNRTSFPVGSRIYYIQRVRYVDGEALIIIIIICFRRRQRTYRGDCGEVNL